MEPVEENSTHNIFIDPAVVDCVREECSLDSPNSSDQESVVENIVWNAPVRINDDQTDSNFQNSVQPSNTVEEIPNGRKGLRPYDRSSRPISFVPDFRKEHNYESKQTETVKFHGFINQNSKYDESSQSLMPSSMPFSGLQVIFSYILVNYSKRKRSREIKNETNTSRVSYYATNGRSRQAYSRL